MTRDEKCQLASHSYLKVSRVPGNEYYRNVAAATRWEMSIGMS